MHVTDTAALLPSLLDAENLLRTLGPYMLPGLCLIIFAECGLLVGFFLPGDSLLFTAGLFVADGVLDVPIWLVCLLLTSCAVLGNVVGYGIGYRAGPALFNRPNSRLFKHEYVARTHGFFDRYGARAIVLARFVPIVRTFITALAGVGRMDRRRYFSYSLIGAVIWAAGVTLLGFWLGKIEFVRGHIDLILVAVVLASVIPIGFEYLRTRRRAAGRRQPAPDGQPQPQPVPGRSPETG